MDGVRRRSSHLASTCIGKRVQSNCTIFHHSFIFLGDGFVVRQCQGQGVALGLLGMPMLMGSMAAGAGSNDEGAGEVELM